MDPVYKKILVIDDDLEIVELARNRLEAQQYQVLTANDGVTGLSLAQAYKPDLIVLDVVMPQMDGYTFIQEIKRQDGLRSIPILVITAKTDMKEIFIAEGVNNCLIKPFQTDVFLNKVRELISK
jgi:adenylate cyclase